jgi:hypothetical protein
MRHPVNSSAYLEIYSLNDKSYQLRPMSAPKRLYIPWKDEQNMIAHGHLSHEVLRFVVANTMSSTFSTRNCMCSRRESTLPMP